MTSDERLDENGASRVGAEMSLLVDVGSAWTKAAAVARSRGRWRIVSHVAQPTGWGEDELRAARLAWRRWPIAAWPNASPTCCVACRGSPATRHGGRGTSAWRPSRQSCPGTPPDARRSRRDGAWSKPRPPTTADRCPRGWPPCRPPTSTCGCWPAGSMTDAPTRR